MFLCSSCTSSGLDVFFQNLISGQGQAYWGKPIVAFLQWENSLDMQEGQLALRGFNDPRFVVKPLLVNPAEDHPGQRTDGFNRRMAYSLQPVPRPKGPPEINVAIPPPPPRPVELVDPEVAKASMTGKVGVMGPPPKDPPPAKASEEVPESSLARPKTKPELGWGWSFFPTPPKRWHGPARLDRRVP